MNKIYALNHSPINFYFSQNARDFIVKEIPLYPFSQSGEHVILHIRKKGLSTQDMLKILASHLGCKKEEFGYAGLKDKAATTTQYISINKKFTTTLSSHLDSLKEQGIKILDQTYHNNKIKIGHLKGNSFFIRLKKVNPTMALQIKEAIENIKIHGLPNYFGYQRFGRDGDNYLEGQKIVQSLTKYRNKTLQNFLISSYQSYLFNQWLSYRMKLNKIFQNFAPHEIAQALKQENISLDKSSIISIKNQQQIFKIFCGDVLEHYPFGKTFHTTLQTNDLDRFLQRSLAPTGLLYGKKSFLSLENALTIEQRFLDPALEKYALGTRRYAWVWPEDINYQYKENNAWFEIGFFLPKGSYATIFIEEIAHQTIKVD
ncbi:tRNA pseudouridine(13) synthase TruD [Helicobacter sp. faydin-H20]|uniref:tRNA pseudouridine(13) synthase TruD n=1 Tax=Helicobacter anatolicus TaxID=2905874 RepID=UPI001E4A9C2A|nr:tRNA pseudouridine(13) synthase TruD [Helicobacter anatolicus]MCE3037359.1 tRNA pseudouridine(13) synthase TruD [Helicobacter anatolicus]